MAEPIIVDMDHAEKMAEWIRDRGGVAVWDSVSLSDPTYQAFTPKNTASGELATKPHWKCGNVPVEVVTDPAMISLRTYKELKRFHVAVRMGGRGMSLKVTDGGSRRIWKAVRKAGEGARYVFDYGDYENAVILVPDKIISLKDYLEEKRGRADPLREAPEKGREEVQVPGES